MEEIPARYDPKGIEDRWYEYWLRENFFTPDPKSCKPTYTIVIPPPNVTGKLTLGHVLNNTVQDILIRYMKILGFETLWLPGMDHAGIATQVKVEEERLLPNGIRKEELGREKFLQEIWKWKEEYASIIRAQLKKMGCALDWTRENFTLSDDYSKKVITVFVKLYEKGLIYRGERIINWCPRCLTALSDEQVETEQKNGKLYFIRYPLKDGEGFVTVATTRPETMLGDTAVCVNPDDVRYQDLIGKTVILPIMQREIPIIADNYVDPEFGTGALKVTPAHDPFDFELAKKHNLRIIDIMNPDGSLNKNAGIYEKVDRFEARNKVLEHLKSLELLEKTENYTVPMGVCERCETPIEPRLSKQWFVRMQPLAKPALDVVQNGQIRIYPKRWTNLYYHWLENVRDWCISRQLWWGHRIPIFYCKKCCTSCNAQTQSSKHGTDQTFFDGTNRNDGTIVSETKPEVCPKCGSKEIYQDEDVLDTWFSSWLWPFATLGWPEQTEDYKKFYPTQTLATGWDIIYLWVARMIMAGIEFTGKIPFSNVVFHPMIRDEKGRKMSKSLGNSPEPMDLIEKYGADALRLGLTLITPREQDVLYTEKSIDVGRKFCNKLWNAARLVFTTTHDSQADNLPEALSDFDVWILEEFNQLLKDIDFHFKNFELNAISRKIYDFFWHRFCDWYLELIKIPPHNGSNLARYMLKQLLIVLHPFIPFITEEIYQRFPAKKKSIMSEAFPVPVDTGKSTVLVCELIALIEEIRNIRGLFSIPHSERLNIIVTTDRSIQDFFEKNIAVFQRLAKINIVLFRGKPEEAAATIVLPKIVAYVILKGIDISKEKKRLDDEIEFLSQRIDELKNRLNNPRYVNQVEESVREKEQKRLEESLIKIEHIRQAIKNL